MNVYTITIAKDQPVTKGTESAGYLNETIQFAANNAWDAAHNCAAQIKGDPSVLYIEPEIDMTLYQDAQDISTIVEKSGSNGYLTAWPSPPPGPGSFVWHLADNYSQLAKAAHKVWDGSGNPPSIKIAHIDTGYEPNHPALPENLDPGISFIENEAGRPAVDVLNGTIAEQQGHGTATMSLLAGRKLSKEQTGDHYEGYFGAIPFATIIPIRICETVALFRSKSFVRAVEYAITQNCEVISMSMAGAPTREWAEVVNKAYEKGIVMVTAAGNNWNKGFKIISPPRLLYPARWERVIAATGITANHTPYVFDAPELALKTAGGETMQGNYGPPEAMEHAIAAYTPNTTWAVLPEKLSGPYFQFDGGGTSSATPQVAAAAALWICYNRHKLAALVGDEPANQWKKVEAVKYGLFQSANRDYKEWKKYLGKGALRAFDALEKFPGEKDLHKSKVATVAWNGVADLLKLLIRKVADGNSVKDDMYITETVQVIHADPALHFLLNYDESEQWGEEDKQQALLIMQQSKLISEALRAKITELKSGEEMENKNTQKITNQQVEKQVNIQEHTGNIIINHYGTGEVKDNKIKQTLSDIQTHITKSEDAEAIEKLLELATVQYPGLLDTAVLLAGHYNDYENSLINGVLLPGEATQRIAQIRKSILMLSKKMKK